jgi:molecular chaperone GrpE
MKDDTAKKQDEEVVEEVKIEDIDSAHDATSKKQEEAKVTEVNVDYKEQAGRAMADYRNLQRKTDEERRMMYDIIKAQILQEFIPTMDMLHTAELFIKDAGLKMVMDQFKKTLSDLGLEEVELLGKDFDPHTAEAVSTVDGTEENKVVKVIKSAYSLGGTIIRIGQVEVSKKV